jgi:hypothetical protein
MSPSFEDRMRTARRLEDQIRTARRHVELNRAVIDHYKELFEKHRVEGRDTKPVENLLETLEYTQEVFEHDLAELERRRGN